MAHFAKVVDGIVQQVIVAESDFFNTFVDTTPGEWIQTSYNTVGGVHYAEGTDTPSSDQSQALRKNYAVIGGHYDVERDAFYGLQPYPSWTLDENTCHWECPVDYPDDGGVYEWNEETQSWDLIE